MLVFFRHAGDSGFVEFEIGAFCDFDDDRGVFDAVDNTVEASGGDDFIAVFEGGDARGLFFALTLLRADEKEVEHHNHDAEHEDGVQGGLGIL